MRLGWMATPETLSLQLDGFSEQMEFLGFAFAYEDGFLCFLKSSRADGEGAAFLMPLLHDILDALFKLSCVLFLIGVLRQLVL